MKDRRPGNTGLIVSEVALGAVLGGRDCWGVGAVFQSQKGEKIEGVGK
jgi:hypothetical protein